MVRILAVGRMQQVMDHVLGEPRDAGYESDGSIDDDTVIEMARASAYDVLVIGGGVSRDDRQRIIEQVRAIAPDIAIAEPSGPAMVLASVRGALEDR